MPRYRFQQLKVPLNEKDRPERALSRALRLPPGVVKDIQVERLSLDGRKENGPGWSFNLTFRTDFPLPDYLRVRRVPELSPPEPLEGEIQMDLPAVVHIVGAGPCGMSAALHLARRGYKVHVWEQGMPVLDRFRDIRHFLKGGKLNSRSNILYGEGGAGAFSDGKLTARNQNPYTQAVLEDWVMAGADPSIRYHSRPHVGTDRLQFIVPKIRKLAEELGAEFHFGKKLEDLEIVDGCVKRFKVEGEWIETEALVIAAGHSARDVYKLLRDQGVKLEAKGFAIGVRVEHPQSLVNRAMLGDEDLVQYTGSAEYVLNCPASEEAAGAYSFCMCPGGVLIPCAGEPGELATNGMSYSRRNTRWSNSGIVVPMNFGEGQDLFRGIEEQEHLERKAFEIGGGTYSAPGQTIFSFLEGKVDSELPMSSFPRGLVPFDHNHFFNAEIVEALKRAFIHFERWIPGFLEKGLIVSPETRTSSPLRVTRDAVTLESVNTRGLFPLGEGAGYAGGIVSSAADGVRFASLCTRRTAVKL